MPKKSDLLKSIEKTRLIIINLLMKNDEMTSSQIQSYFLMSQSAISQHLKILEDIELVNVKEDGPYRVYSVDKKKLEYLKQYLGQNFTGSIKITKPVPPTTNLNKRSII